MKRILSILVLILVAVFWNSAAMAQSDDGKAGWEKNIQSSKDDLSVYTHKPTESRIDVYDKELKNPSQSASVIEAFHRKLKDTVGFKLVNDTLGCEIPMTSVTDCTRAQYKFENSDVKDIRVEVVSFTKERHVFFIVLYYPEKSRDEVWGEYLRRITLIDKE
ncbi:MAG: hypothetical protein J6A01_12995 [Proteobacteria bacterium]|nr:hypothetical protein [Pseudomonadota bacterium]